jgi:O-antigen/teichoic acid export membrane protein
MMRAYLGQTAWLMLERILRLALGAGVSILMARSLGPGGLGQLSAAQAMLAVLSPFAALGLDALTVRWLLAKPQEAGRLLATLLCTKVVGALLAQAGLLLACNWLPSPEAGLVAILSSLLLLQAPLTLDQYFQSRVRGRLSALAQITALILCGGLKLAMVYWHSSVYWFAAAICAEAAITALLLFFAFYRLPDHPRLERPSAGLSRASLRQSFPLILSTIVATLFVSTDQLMLRTLAGATAVGIYAAAVRLTEAWYALLTVMASSVFPAIVQRALAGDARAHQRQMQLFYELSFLLSVAVALPVSLFSGRIIPLLYGPQFAQSAVVLVVHIWAGIFIGWRLLSGKWMLAEGLIRLSLYRSLWGVALNLGLAWLLIPRYGVAGSAWAALSANAVVGLVSDLFNPLTRQQGMLKLRSIGLGETRILARAMILRLRPA